MKKDTNYILGLDIGTNSIGWAVVPCDIETEIVDAKKRFHYLPKTCIALNSRIFQEMLDKKTGVTKNQKRRAKRGARRNIDRLQERRRDLKQILVKAKLLPTEFLTADKENNNGLLNNLLNDIDKSFASRLLKKEWNSTWNEEDRIHVSPFAIRAYAAEGRQLEPYEFGRAIFHLQRRRGYFSNRDVKYRNLLEHLRKDPDKEIQDIDAELAGQVNDKENDKEDKDENKKVLGGLKLLKNQLKNQTLGQFIWEQAKKQKQAPQRITRYGEIVIEKKKDQEIKAKKDFFAERAMYKQELKTIWEAQKSNKKLKNILTEELKEEIEHAILFQRPLQSQKGKVGKCSFMLQRKRTHKATLEFQEYRIRQAVNHLRVKGKPLSEEVREILFCKTNNNVMSLNQDGRLSWKEVSQIINSDKKSINFQPGLEEGQDIEEYKKSFCRSGLVGNRTAKIIVDTLGLNKWESFSSDQSQLVRELAYYENKIALYKRLCNHWKLSAGYDKDAYKLAIVELPDNTYAKHCNYVINKLLVYLRQGKIYSEACDEAGFYKESSDILNSHLPLNYNDIENIANPRVQKALFEIRKVINSVYKSYGKPSIIRVEMARDMKNSKKHRKEIEEEQGINRAANATADQEIRETINSNTSYKNLLNKHRSGYSYVSRELRNKYKMWKFEQKHLCPYCGHSISSADLFNGAAEVDHILPQTSFSDNYLNTVVTCKTCNQEKKGRSPYGAWGNNENRWNIIENNMKKFDKLPKVKKERILKKDFEIEDVSNFTQRHLRDTTYIAVACKNMLEKSGIRVQVSKGGATAKLRHYWGLDDLLPRHPEDQIENNPKDEKNEDILKYAHDKSKPKNRKDHRHHAIDALMVALTNHATLQKLVTYHQERQIRYADVKQQPLMPPKTWQEKNMPKFVKNKLMNSVVSHSPSRKIKGELHEETIFSRSHYRDDFPLGTSTTTIKGVKEYLENDESMDGEVTWIIGDNIKNILQIWVKDSLKQKLKDRCLPFNPRGQQLNNVAIAHRCYTTTKNLDDIIKDGKISYTNGEWQPGKKTWIADKQVFLSLQKWQEIYKDNVKENLMTNPPRIIDTKGKESEQIKSVRLAEICKIDSVIPLHGGKKIVKSGNNHHVEIFRQISPDGKVNKKRGRFVNMLTAAQRASRKEPIVDQKPDPSWPGEWKFWISLCANDIVRMPDDNEYFTKHEHLGLPYYRVKIMTHRGEIIRFKHHSVSTSEDEDPGYIQKSVNSLPDDMQKIELGTLGITA